MHCARLVALEGEQSLCLTLNSGYHQEAARCMRTLVPPRLRLFAPKPPNPAHGEAYDDDLQDSSG